MMSEKMMEHSNQLVTFLSAFAAGYFVFGTNNKLNMQVSISTTSTAVEIYDIPYYVELLASRIFGDLFE